jgi:hypothetical protein
MKEVFDEVLSSYLCLNGEYKLSRKMLIIQKHRIWVRWLQECVELTFGDVTKYSELLKSSRHFHSLNEWPIGKLVKFCKLYKSWREFAKKNEVLPGSIDQFKRKLLDIGIAINSTKTGKEFLGIQFKRLNVVASRNDVAAYDSATGLSPRSENAWLRAARLHLELIEGRDVAGA